MRESRDHGLQRKSVSVGVLSLLLAAATVTPGSLPAQEKRGLRGALENGKATVNLRYRYEDVSEEFYGDRHARASTLRTALGYRSRAYKRFILQIEAENVSVIGNDLYNSGGPASINNRVRDRPLVADPADTEINQALIRYVGNRWQVAAGRQEIRLGDERFVGNVGWRQNHQSFDALRIDSNSLGGLRVTYIYIDRVHRVFGRQFGSRRSPAQRQLRLQNAGKFTLYGYLLDYQDRPFDQLSTATWGLEFAGQRSRSGRRSLLYEIEHARQSDHADNPFTVDASYTSLMIGTGLPGATLKLAREQHDGNPGSGAFRTPLATLHKFNGWADKFPFTPIPGLEDLYLQLDGKVGQLAWLVKYHDFDAAEPLGLIRPGARPAVGLYEPTRRGGRPQGRALRCRPLRERHRQVDGLDSVRLLAARCYSPEPSPGAAASSSWPGSKPHQISTSPRARNSSSWRLARPARGCPFCA